MTPALAVVNNTYAEATQLHPKAAANKAAREAEALNEKAEREREKRLTAAYKLRYLHVKHGDERMTIAYQKSPRGKRNDCIVKVSVANVHPNDCYCKRIGRRVAATKFDRGNHIQLKVPAGMTTVSALHYYLAP